jgi:hypothetical protein
MRPLLARLAHWRLPLLLIGLCGLLGLVIARQLAPPPPPPGSTTAAASSAGPLAGTGGSTTVPLPQDDAVAAEENGGEAADFGEVAESAADGGSLPPLAAFSTTVERPLFSRNRRPPPPGEAAGAELAQGTATEMPFLLSGVLIAGPRRVALLQTRASPKTLRVEEGETVEGWKVVTIRPQAVVVRSGSGQQELKLLDRIANPAALQRPPSPGRPAARRPVGQPGAPPPPDLPPDQPVEGEGEVPQ